jgi:UDP-N-acetylglucosamine diphosphorylase/glucosamine-1-phosphate N-acetyltransferase
MAVPAYVCVFEDEKAEAFLPLTYTRAVFDLRCGIRTIAEKIEGLYAGAELYRLTRPHLASVTERSLNASARDVVAGSRLLLINGRILPTPELASIIPLHEDEDVLFVCGDVLVAARLSTPRLGMAVKWLAEQDSQSVVAAFGAEVAVRPVDIRLLEYPWQLVHENGGQIRCDFKAMKRSPHPAEPHPLATLYAEENIYLAPGAEIMAGAVLDARNGPIYVDENARVEPFSFIQGPAYIGRDSRIVSGKIREDTSIGPHCRIGGEVESTIFHAYSNKYHDGFVGHSYFGEWVNLGALTTTSDLKNTYGTVRVDVAGAQVDTRLTKLGSIVGDHVKLGIGVLLNSGTTIGVGCNLFGGGMMPKIIPCFVWGGDGEFQEYDLDRMLRTAEIAMSRRNVEVSPEVVDILRYVFELTASSRRTGRV